MTIYEKIDLFLARIETLVKMLHELPTRSIERHGRELAIEDADRLNQWRNTLRGAKQTLLHAKQLPAALATQKFNLAEKPISGIASELNVYYKELIAPPLQLKVPATLFSGKVVLAPTKQDLPTGQKTVLFDPLFGGSPEVADVVDDVIDDVIDETFPPIEEEEGPSLLRQWGLPAAIIVGAGGLLWFLTRRRR